MLNQGHDPQMLLQAISRFRQARILVIGDVIVDHFIWGTVSRISPEAPVPVVEVTSDSLLLGGAANVLHNLHTLGATATLCGVIGEDSMGEQFLGMLTELGSSPAGIMRASDRPTMVKTRILAQGQQVVRFDREKTDPFAPALAERIKGFLADQADRFDVIVISDYAKGMITQELMDFLAHKFQSLGKRTPIIVDPKPKAGVCYRGATLITPNHHEAEMLAAMPIRDEESLRLAAQKIITSLDADAVLVTRGEAGMALFEKNGSFSTISTVAKEVYDVTGAGDTVIATLAAAIGVGLSFAAAAVLANHAAGIVVAKIGTAAVKAEELQEALT